MINRTISSKAHSLSVSGFRLIRCRGLDAVVTPDLSRVAFTVDHDRMLTRAELGAVVRVALAVSGRRHADLGLDRLRVVGEVGSNFLERGAVFALA